MKAGNSPVVVIPSFNPGSVVLEVVREVSRHAGEVPVWVMIDGSTDDTPRQLAVLGEDLPQLRLFHFPHNRGKGSVMLDAARHAVAEGFTHVLSFDSDGQHPADHIPRFLQASRARPEALILGRPQFGREAPIERVLWRKAANFWTSVITLGGGIGDSLFGMRVYPAEPLVDAMESTKWARRFDFEPETVVRLSWMGHPAINLLTPVRYLNRAEGGVSHFRYLRDNLLLTGMYVRLFAGMIRRLPRLIRRSATPSRHQPSPSSG